MHNSVLFSAFTMLCKHRYYQIIEYFHHPKKKLSTCWRLATTNLGQQIINTLTTAHGKSILTQKGDEASFLKHPHTVGQ